VGVCDVSTLGKIDLQGPDAVALLDRLYIKKARIPKQITFKTKPQIALEQIRLGMIVRPSPAFTRKMAIYESRIASKEWARRWPRLKFVTE
jgi:hypothetical protein